MQGYLAYTRKSQPTVSRVEIIIATYRKAIECIGRAKAMAEQDQADGVQNLVTQVKFLITNLASGMAGATDDTAVNFLRLFEFVHHCLNHPTLANLESAEKPLRTLLEAFEAIRDKAIAMEQQGLIPSLADENQFKALA